MKKLVVLFLFLMTMAGISAQDFQCQLSINSQQISGSNREKFNSLQQELIKFINDRKWCQYNLKINERINCGIMINLESQSGDVLTGSMTIQLQRPVYKTNYKTDILNFQDKAVQFTYIEGTPLEYADNANLNQLTTLIAFYLNLFLGMEFDTFSMNGGAPYFDKCQNMIDLCQSVKEPGWKSYESGQANRYWILENLNNPSYSEFHEFLYNYHRLGLDVMADSPDAGRAVIAESLRLLQNINSQRSGLYLMQIIVQSKATEIINIFRNGTQGEKTQVAAIMKVLDPANASRYDVLTQSK